MYQIFPRKYFSVFLEILLNTHKEENRYKMHLFQKKEQFGRNSYARKLLLSVQKNSVGSYKLTLEFWLGQKNKIIFITKTLQFASEIF